MPTYRLTVEYEGTRYRGWQEQQNARTVAGELKRAIEKVAGPVQDLGGSGRTDAGVHAAAQTAHLRIARAMDPDALRAAVNELLPADVHLLAAGRAPDRFHARHDARLRSYVYQIALRRTAFAKRFVWWVRRPLAMEPIEDAARLLTGRHDFALFCERPQDQASTIVVVEPVEVRQAEALLLVRLSASHFLWKMVRRLVGALVEVGSGGCDPSAFEALVGGDPATARRLDPGRWTAPPSGLFLERVIYPGEPPLASLAPVVPVPVEPPQSPDRGSVQSPGGGSHARVDPRNPERGRHDARRTNDARDRRSKTGQQELGEARSQSFKARTPLSQRIGPRRRR